jgi:hypothetical protein
MLQGWIDDLREATGSALRLTSLAVIAALALFITTGFVCAAAFVFVLEKYGPVPACFAGAAIFFVVTLIAAGSYMARKKALRRAIEARAEQAARAAAAAPSMLADPAMLAMGLQIVRAVGVKRLIPLLAIGGLALGFLASRNAAGSHEAPAE